MTTLSKLDLSSAGVSYAVANAPLFLLDQLRSAVAVETAGEKYSAEDLLQRAERALLKKPKTLDDFVLPYVYLVALAAKRHLPYLKRAAALPAQNSKWFKYIADVLVDEYIPTSSVRLKFLPIKLDKMSKETSLKTKAKTYRRGLT